MQRVDPLRLLALVPFVALASGCSISNSSETISDSLSSPFRWSSDSSTSGGEESAYRRDVSHYAASFAREGGDLDAFRTGVRQLAEAHGITNWEEDALTCASIGLGLQLAGLDASRAERFGDALLTAHPQSLAALRSGYASTP
jgi:hypothetical protein